MHSSRIRPSYLDAHRIEAKVTFRRSHTEMQLAIWEWAYAHAELAGPMLGIPVWILRSWAAGELMDATKVKA